MENILYFLEKIANGSESSASTKVVTYHILLLMSFVVFFADPLKKTI